MDGLLGSDILVIWEIDLHQTRDGALLFFPTKEEQHRILSRKIGVNL